MMAIRQASLSQRGAQKLPGLSSLGVAGHMVETITGKPWEQLMRELVFEPLGMDSAPVSCSTWESC